MPDPTRIDVADLLNAALDGDAQPPSFDATDVIADLVSFGLELRSALQQPSLTAVERARIHARAVDLVEGRGFAGLRRAWPQLTHPAVVGGAAAAVLAVAGLVALRERRGHGTASVLRAA